MKVLLNKYSINQRTAGLTNGVNLTIVVSAGTPWAEK